MDKIEQMVIGKSDNFTLALGKYAFTPCGDIPKDYLNNLLDLNMSVDDRKIIYDYLQKSKEQ